MTRSCDVGTDAATLVESLTILARLPIDQATSLPPSAYTSDSLLALEQQRIFNRQWLCAGRADCIASPGDYMTWSIGLQPIIIIRQKDQSIKAFANVCRHRMMQLLEGNGNCANKPIVCPYHAWSYAADGRLVAAPQMHTRPGFDKSDYSLASVRVESWEGWLYVTLDHTLPSVAESLVDLHDLVKSYRMESYVQIVQEDHVWDTNWKLLTENFMEGYHLPVAHKATVGGYFAVGDTRFSESAPNPAFTYQSFSKSEGAPVGNAHPDNTWLKDEQRQTSIMPTVFPSHMYVLAPDHLWYLSLQPQGSHQVRVRYGAAMAPEVLAASDDPERLKQDIRDFLAKVNEEDKTLVESIFTGSKAPLSVPGPLCWLERENHEFTQYLARILETQR